MELGQPCSSSTCASIKVYHSTRSVVIFSRKLWLLFSGEHPRIGAMDVCPFIPVKNVTMEECIECAKEFAERLALEMDVPGIRNE